MSDFARQDLAEADPRLKDEKVQNILADMDRRVAGGQAILGPDGRPILLPVKKDHTVTYAQDGESASVDVEDVLMKGARMLRDGWGLGRIRSELDLIDHGPQEVSLKVLEAALVQVGMPLLDLAIAEGREPAESVTFEGYEEAGMDDEPIATKVEPLNMVEQANEKRRQLQEARRGA